VVAAAGKNPGAVEEPAAEPNVFAVGADTAQPGSVSDTAAGAVCSFSANQAVGLYAPGCGLDGADPFTDTPFCCEDGTSQASAFTAAVLVAMMSYDQTLSYTNAEQLLVQTAQGGDLDVAAAFQADDLGQIVSEGEANVPTTPTAQPPATSSGSSGGGTSSRNSAGSSTKPKLTDQLPLVDTDLSANNIFFGVECDQVDNLPTCGAASSGSHAAEAEVYSAQVTLVQSSQPVVQNESGPLWGQGPVWGTVPVNFDAADVSGIARVDVLSPTGGELQDDPQGCSYSQVQACPELPADQLEINTLELPDGPEHISLQLTNAAGNTTVAQGPTVVIDNNGPPAASSLTAAAATSTSNLIDLAWSDPPNPPEPVQDAYAQLRQATCQTPVQVSPSGGAQITAAAAGTYTVRLWLTDTAGRGSSANAATTSVTVPAPTPCCATTTQTSSKTPCTATRCPVTLKVTSAKWKAGALSLIVTLPKGETLKITLEYAHHRPVTLNTSRTRVSIKTTKPSEVLVRAYKGKRQQGKTIVIKKL
jgi:hypothetical protein